MSGAALTAVSPWAAGSAVSAVVAVTLLVAANTVARRARTRHRQALLAGARTTPARRLRRPWRRGRPTPDRRLPLVAELLAACLAAGASPVSAAAAVGGCLDGPLAAALRRAATELRLGGDPSVAWGRVGVLPGAAGLARRLELADSAGVSAVTAVAREATEYRARQARAAQVRTRRAAVHLAAPLGLCFLPAFLLLGVAPVVLGLARTLL